MHRRKLPGRRCSACSTGAACTHLDGGEVRRVGQADAARGVNLGALDPAQGASASERADNQRHCQSRQVRAGAAAASCVRCTRRPMLHPLQICIQVSACTHTYRWPPEKRVCGHRMSLLGQCMRVHTNSCAWTVMHACMHACLERGEAGPPVVAALALFLRPLALHPNLQHVSIHRHTHITTARRCLVRPPAAGIPSARIFCPPGRCMHACALQRAV